MKSAEELFKKLGIKSYTKRHLQVVNDFIANKETDCKKLLTQLGNWDKNDLSITEQWLKKVIN